MLALINASVLDSDTKQQIKTAANYFTVVDKAKICDVPVDADFSYDSKVGEMSLQLQDMNLTAVYNMGDLATWLDELKGKLDEFQGHEVGSVFNMIGAPAFLDKLRIAGT